MYYEGISLPDLAEFKLLSAFFECLFPRHHLERMATMLDMYNIKQTAKAKTFNGPEKQQPHADFFQTVINLIEDYHEKGYGDMSHTLLIGVDDHCSIDIYEKANTYHMSEIKEDLTESDVELLHESSFNYPLQPGYITIMAGMLHLCMLNVFMYIFMYVLIVL